MRVSTNIFLVFLVCAGCASRSAVSPIAAGGDPSGAPQGLPPPVPSTINIPVEIETAIMEKAVNGIFDKMAHVSDTAILGGLTNIRITVRKNGPVKISARGDELSYSVPVTATIRVSTSISVMGLSHTEYQDAEAGIAFRLRSKISLKNDWRIATATKALGYTWTSEPVLKARFITIPIKPAANLLADKMMEALCPLIDNSLSNYDIIKKSVVTPLWEALYAPIGFPVPGTREFIWLRFDPTGISLSNLNGHGGYISALVGIRAVTEAVIGGMPEKRAPAPLPNFTGPQSKDSAFAINIYTEVPYDRVTALCKETFNGKTFKSGMHRVTVNDISVTGATADGLLAITMELSGSLKGTALVTGQAVYVDAEKAMSLDNLNFDMATASRYQKARSRLLKGIIINKMKPHIKFPLSEILNAEALTEILRGGYKIQKGTTLSGKIDSIAVRGVEATDSALRATVLALGTAAITVSK